jgi:hypothetical protein
MCVSGVLLNRVPVTGVGRRRARSRSADRLDGDGDLDTATAMFGPSWHTVILPNQGSGVPSGWSNTGTGVRVDLMATATSTSRTAWFC